MVYIILLFVFYPTLTVSAKTFQQETVTLDREWSSTRPDETYSIAWGDVDGDGDLDLAVGNTNVPNRLYLNNGNGLESEASWSSDESVNTESIAWGDVDGDGDLDLAVGNSNFDDDDNGAPNQIYLNINGILKSEASWSSDEFDNTVTLAWGDVDGDGDLDLAVGNSEAPNRLYLNDGNGLESMATWSSDESDYTESIAWGDLDGDGDLDLAVGNDGASNRVYLNIGGELESTGSWSSDEEEITYGIALGDIDGDGDLDLAAGNADAPNRVYLNAPDGLESSASWASNDAESTTDIALVDVNGNGYLDLTVVNWGESNQVYLNLGEELSTEASWFSDETDDSQSLAWGDVDGDGDLDLAVGNEIEPTRVYVNSLGRLSSDAAWSSSEVDNTISIIWGDVDGDGDLDLAAGNSDMPNRIYLNTGTQLELEASWSSVESDDTQNLAWGDIDGDGDLDLAAGNWGAPNHIYLNTDDGLESQASWTSNDIDDTLSIAWGDVDGDGDLDLAVGNVGGPNRVYQNTGERLELEASWSSDELDDTQGLAWGDVDNDGDLDLAVGNDFQSNRVYLNINGRLTSQASWSSDEEEITLGIAWGDVDGDGDLDLATQNDGASNRIYLNQDGQLSSQSTWSSDEPDDTESIAWGDADGDGDLDLAVGNWNESNRLYLNVDGQLSSQSSWSSEDFDDTESIAWGDMDGDGDLDLAVGNYEGENRVYLNDNVSNQGSIAISLVSDESVPSSATGYSSANIISTGIVKINFQLFDSTGTPADVVGYYSPNGGGYWLPAIPTINSNTRNLTTLPPTSSPTEADTHVFEWDVLASGLFGQSDNVAFRLEARPSLKPRRNDIAGPFQFPRYASQTSPFRLRGYQVRVLADTENQRVDFVQNALVLRLPDRQLSGAEPLGGLAIPYVTNSNGYLGGREQFEEGDQLIALQSISRTQTFEVYYTSASPIDGGLAMQAVDSDTNIQELRISNQNPLILFDLDIALEWDARKETQFMALLEQNIHRTSAILYDWTNGQSALGHVRIFHDAKNLPAFENNEDESQNGWQPWVDSHVRLFATNRMRPSAALGGVTIRPITDTANSDIVYLPGQVQIGSVWNRYGESSGTLGEDWPRVLAHELAHYLLYLDDNYLGLDNNGVLIPVTSCPGAMSDPYRDDYSEFHPSGDWELGCSETLSQRGFKRSDWETVKTHYDWIQEPDSNFDELLKGPVVLPLAVTQIESYSAGILNFHASQEPFGLVTVITNTANITNTETIEPPIWYLNQNGASTKTGDDARAYLIQQDWLIDLGRPNLGEVMAHGARAGDRLCVFELTALRGGCEILSAGDNQLDLYTNEVWKPEIRVSPANTNTIDIAVAGIPAGLALRARHYPRNGPANPPIDLISVITGSNKYIGTFDLIHAAAEGHVHIWVPSDDPVQRREAIVDYSMGGSPGFAVARGGFAVARGGFAVARGGFAVARGGFAVARGGFAVARGGFAVARGGFAVARGAPAMSSDGQVVLIGDRIKFDEGEFYTLQSSTVLPDAPKWARVIGNGYWLSASPGAPDLTNRGETTVSISFRYLGAEVPVGEEKFLKLYFWDGQNWEVLPTKLDTQQNFAAALTEGSGLYALMSSIDIHLYSTGWNLVSYPVQDERSVDEALASIEGSYSIVYGYHPEDGSEPWRVYGVDAPDYVNSLKKLEFGRGYWIATTEAITLSLKGKSDVSAAGTNTLFTPPSTFYGGVQSAEDFIPSEDMPVHALINGVICGEGQTQAIEEQIVYVIHVNAESGNGCGVVGRNVTIQIADQHMTSLRWNNNFLQEQIFVPNGFGSSQPDSTSSSRDTFIPFVSN